MQFSEVVGHDKIKAELIQGVKNEKVSHSQLFLSPEGAGGLPLALAYITYINCENKTDNDSCGQCSSCQKMKKLIHPDVHFSFPVITTGKKDPPVSDVYIKEFREAVIDNPYLNYFDWLQQLDAGNKQGNITVKECREIIKKVTYKAFEGGAKAVIMWMPEKLGKEGNALLKILEEPPANTYFILVAEDAGMILNTILSRTQLTRIPRINDDEVKESLMKNQGLNEHNAEIIARLAEGNYHEALSSINEVNDDYGQMFKDWLRLCFARELQKLLKWTDQMAGTGREAQKNFLKYALQKLEQIIQLKSGVGEAPLSEEDDFFNNITNFIEYETVLKIYEAVNEAHYHVERNASPRIVFFNLSLTINGFFTEQRMARTQ